MNRDYPDFASEPPSSIVSFAISLTAPEYGWIGLQMRAAQTTYEIALSCVFDPFDNIRQFLEHLAAGRDAQLLIHDEGHFHFFRASEMAANGQLRLGLWNSLERQNLDGPSCELTLVWDVMTDRDAFVGSFYRAMIEIWGVPDDLSFRRAWFNFAEDEDPYEDDFGFARTLPRVRSPTLDQLLG